MGFAGFLSVFRRVQFPVGGRIRSACGRPGDSHHSLGLCRRCRPQRILLKSDDGAPLTVAMNSALQDEDVELAALLAPSHTHCDED